MAKYKLTVKYNSVCDLSIAGDIPDIIANEFDQYVKSMLYKKEEWENFEANFKLAAKKEYGNIKKAKRKEEEASNEAETLDAIKDSKTENEALKADDNKTAKPKNSLEELKEMAENINGTEEDKKKEEPNETQKEEIEQKEADEKPKKPTIVSFGEYVEDKNINTPLDEFVAGACYLDKILNIKEFSLKQLNAKLFPVFGRLASSEIIDKAIERVLIEIIKDGAHQRYKINQNAWNYHDFDLVKHS